MAPFIRIFIVSTFLQFMALVLLAQDGTGDARQDGDRTASTRATNFIIIFCDDMGYADIGPFGAKGYQTPHLDRMAREGMKFTDFYVG